MKKKYGFSKARELDSATCSTDPIPAKRAFTEVSIYQSSTVNLEIVIDVVLFLHICSLKLTMCKYNDKVANWSFK